MFALIATVLFLLAAFGQNHIGSVNTVDLGLACLALHLLVGLWPFGSILSSRQQ